LIEGRKQQIGPFFQKLWAGVTSNFTESYRVYPPFCLKTFNQKKNLPSSSASSSGLTFLGMALSNGLLLHERIHLASRTCSANGSGRLKLHGMALSTAVVSRAVLINELSAAR
jgi:hypothetical protein